MKSDLPANSEIMVMSKFVESEFSFIFLPTFLFSAFYYIGNMIRTYLYVRYCMNFDIGYYLRYCYQVCTKVCNIIPKVTSILYYLNTISNDLDHQLKIIRLVFITIIRRLVESQNTFSEWNQSFGKTFLTFRDANCYACCHSFIRDISKAMQNSGRRPKLRPLKRPSSFTATNTTQFFQGLLSSSTLVGCIHVKKAKNSDK